MLTICKECGGQVSDKAISCPHCGVPVRTKRTRPPGKATRRKRLPNGFGQITEVKGQGLKKPFRVMISQGFNEKGRPIVRIMKPEGYFQTYNEAYEALLHYHQNPYDLSENVTMNGLFERWLKEYREGGKAKSSVNVHKSAWGFCEPIYNIPVRSFRIRHILWVTENDHQDRLPSPGMRLRIKMLLNLLLDYAVRHELTDHNYARDYRLPEKIGKEAIESAHGHITYTKEEMETLWTHQNDMSQIINIILIQCYSGWRPEELLSLRMENVNITNWTFTGGIKTTAGKNRIVPIHTRIRPLVLTFYNHSKELRSEWLICQKNAPRRIWYYEYREEYHKTISKLGLNPEHKPHDGRVCFVSMAKEAEMDDYALKRIVGHTIKDLTEKTYTKRSIEWLHREIEKIK